jgi:N-methylhydantoinase B
MTELDPITHAVMRNAFLAAAREMYTVFKRTAMLPVLYESHDFGMSLFDDRLNLVADAPGLPIFLGSLDICIERTLDEIGGAENLEPGDVLLNNHPYLTAGQPADAAVIEPIFHDGKLIAYAALRGHMGDFGAKGPYPTDSTDLWQEGTLFPGLKLYKAGELNEDVLRILRANSRLPAETAGSTLAGAGAVQACSRKMTELVSNYGRDAYYAAIDRLLRDSERAARGAIGEIADGVYPFEDWMDDDGVEQDPVLIKGEITVNGSDITIDLSESAPEVKGPINCPWGYTVTTCRFALKRITTPGLAPSSGDYAPLTVIAPEGTLFNPRVPAPTFISWASSVRLGDVIVKALAPGMPEGTPADNGGDLMGLLGYISDPDTGRLHFFYDDAALGHGATSARDGMNALYHPTSAGCRLVPTEVTETRLPVVKKRFELTQDSGGPGRFRGGLSATAQYELRGGGLAIAIAEKTRASKVEGLEGGLGPPFPNAIRIFPDTEKELRLGKASDVPVEAGDEIEMRPTGGGGYGDPLDREVERVWRDVRDEYVSVEQARRVYGVVVDPDTGAVDETATQELRAQLRNGGRR